MEQSLEMMRKRHAVDFARRFRRPIFRSTATGRATVTLLITK